jgi:hypothetical protein
MSNLRKRAFKTCIKWDSIGKTCLEERYAVWLEDAQKELLELKQKLQQLRDFWVTHIEPVDDEQPHPYFFTLRSFTKEEKLKVEKLLKEAKQNEVP